GGRARAVAVEVAGIARSVVGDEDAAGARPYVEPAGNRRVVRPRRRAARGQRVEALGVRGPESRQGNLGFRRIRKEGEDCCRNEQGEASAHWVSSRNPAV